MFIGQRYELICTGGEVGFLGYHRMVSPEEYKIILMMKLLFLQLLNENLIFFNVLFKK